MKPSYNEHISKSQGAAQLRVQLITTIYDLLNAQIDITRVPSLMDHGCFVGSINFVNRNHMFDKLWIVVGRKITESNYRS